MLYNPVKLDVPTRYHELIKKALSDEKRKHVSVKVNLCSRGEDGGNETLLLTHGQIAKIDRARIIGKKKITIRMSRNQVKKNLKHEGGFLGMLIAALTAAIPALLATASEVIPEVIAGVATGAIADAIGGSGLYFRKNGLFAKVQLVNGGGLFLSPHPPPDVEEEGDGIFDFLKAKPRPVDEELVKKHRKELPQLLEAYEKGDKSKKWPIQDAASYLLTRKLMSDKEWEKIQKTLGEELGDGLYLKHEGKTEQVGGSWIKDQVPILGLLL